MRNSEGGAPPPDAPGDIARRIAVLDISIFQRIRSETSEDDKRALLLLLRTLRERKPFVYLEIGSHLGGTIQPFYADPLCSAVISIDKRPPWQPDERWQLFGYSENSTARMLERLHQAYPEVPRGKITTHDCDASELDPESLAASPTLCFIDGEHTLRAARSDFEFCLRAASRDAVIAFHDSDVVGEAILAIEDRLASEGITHRGLLLPGCVYALLLNGAIASFHGELAPHARDAGAFFSASAGRLAEIRSRNRGDLRRVLRDWLLRSTRLHRALRRVRTLLRGARENAGADGTP